MDKDVFKLTKCLVVLSGIPGCGKTTLAKFIFKQLERCRGNRENTEQFSGKQDNCGVIVISYDDFIPNDLTLDDTSQQKWKEYREELVLCIDQLLFLDTLLIDKFEKPLSCVSDAIWKNFCEILKNQLNLKPVKCIAIVIDDNMYYTSMRHRYYQLARKHTCGFCQLFLTCSVEEALQRNRQRERPIPENVIIRMATKIEVPNASVNHWEQNTLIINTLTNVESHISEILSLIKATMMNPVQPLDETDSAVIAESRQICSSNVIHQSDQILRRIVGQKMEVIKSNVEDKATLQNLSKKYIDIRKTCLEKIKTGQVSFPVTADKPDISCDINSELYQQILRLFEQFVKEVT